MKSNAKTSKQIINALSKVSEALDDLGFVKSSLFAMKTMDEFISEAADENDEFPLSLKEAIMNWLQSRSNFFSQDRGIDDPELAKEMEEELIEAIKESRIDESTFNDIARKMFENMDERELGGHHANKATNLLMRVWDKANPLSSWTDPDESSEDNLDGNFKIYVSGEFPEPFRELATIKNTIEEAIITAKQLSKEDLDYTFEVELEPGGNNNPTYKSGRLISGLRI